MYLFDSHAHYFDDRFYNPSEGPVADELLPALFTPEGSVGHIINIGTNINTSRSALEQAARYPGMFAAVGIHPEDCQLLEDDAAQLHALRDLLCCNTPDPVAARKQSKIVALGEIGLDYFERDWLPVDKLRQRWYFERQLEISAEQDLPVIVHDREAHGDCFETVLRYPAVRGVFHSFSGSVEMARELVKRGWYISFSGVVTFKNARRIGEVATSIPPDRLLVETDAPYLTPRPYRGKRNNSALMRYTVETLATLHNMSFDEMVDLTAANAARLFGISLQ